MVSSDPCIISMLLGCMGQRQELRILAQYMRTLSQCPGFHLCTCRHPMVLWRPEFFSGSPRENGSPLVHLVCSSAHFAKSTSILSSFHLPNIYWNHNSSFFSSPNLFVLVDIYSIYSWFSLFLGLTFYNVAALNYQYCTMALGGDTGLDSHHNIFVISSI